MSTIECGVDAAVLARGVRAGEATKGDDGYVIEDVVRAALGEMIGAIRNELVYRLIEDYDANAGEIGINGIEYWLTGYLSLPRLEGGAS